MKVFPLWLASIALLPSVAAAQDFAPKDGIPPGYVLFEGDILLPIDFWEGTFTTDIWPAVIPYEFDTNVTPANQALMLAAMNEVETICYVFFVPLAGHPDYIHIQNSTRNNSAIGRQGGEQIINIVSWGSNYVLIHELMHAMGFWHEQSRMDRDTYVEINFENISQTACGGPCDDNFEIQPMSAAWGPYDFDSVMHYGRAAFSANGMDTITVLPPFEVWQDLIGQRTHLSELDQRVLSYMYRQPDWRFARYAPLPGTFENGTFFFPYHSFPITEADTPPGGRILLLDQATYPAAGVYTKPLTIECPLGGAVLQ